jgi:PAS domain S-box-containing protein
MTPARLQNIGNGIDIHPTVYMLVRSIRCLFLFLLLLLLLLLSLFATYGYAEEKQKFIAVGDHDFPPYEFQRDGKTTGFTIELIKAVAEVMGMEVETHSGPWDTILNDLEQDRIDVLTGMVYSEERAKRFNFTTPHSLMSPGLFVRKNSGIESLADLRDKEVIVQNRDIMHDYLLKHKITSRIITVSDPPEAMRLLSSGKHDAAFLSSEVHGYYIAGALQLTNLHAIKTNIEPQPYCFAIAKKKPELAAKLNEGMTILKATGRYRAIYDTWFAVYEKRDWWSTIRNFVVALGVIGALFAASLLWSWSLRRRVKRRTAELLQREEELRKARTDLEQRVAERTAELFSSRSMLRTVLDTIPQRVFWKDRALLFVGCNRPLAQDYGYDDPALLIGKTDFELVAAEAAERYRADDRLVMETGQPKLNAEEQQRKPDGGLGWSRISRVPLRDKDGRVIGILGMYEDITDYKKMEQELIKAQKLESVGVLAGGIAHDFNNLLTAILGNISLLRIKLPHTATTDQYLERAETASHRAKDLTHQLLTFAKGGAPVRKALAAGEVIKTYARLTLSGSKSTCTFLIPDDLRPISADEGQLSQVINNLVINAAQAMPEGGTIEIQCENVVISETSGLPLKAGDYVRVSIKDEGAGIPEENLAKIFDPYFTTKTHGRGLGLASTYSIIKSHDGHIAVESTVGFGTTFTMYLPAAQAQEEAEASKKETGQPLPGSGKILVMDDEKIVREIAAAMLTHLGYSVEVVKDGEEAIALYVGALEAHDPFIAVIMDLTIPGGMGGKEIITKLQKIDPNVKAIVSSGYSNDPIMANYREYGFAGVVMKPYRLDELAEQVEKILRESA